MMSLKMELLATITNKILCGGVLFPSKWGCLSPKGCDCFQGYSGIKVDAKDQPEFRKESRNET